jgi:hypothetical protein
VSEWGVSQDKKEWREKEIWSILPKYYPVIVTEKWLRYWNSKGEGGVIWDVSET